jgi:hypothetical protein
MDLSDYRDWLGKSASTILQAVIAERGWSRVFPWGRKFPTWASRVRNYFNVTPRRLKLLDEGLSKALVERNNAFVLGNDYKAALALSGDVYVDERRRLWFEMRAGGAVYHYEGRGFGPGAPKAIVATLQSQKHVPVFKLVSPDPTGGSSEVCV